MKLTGPKAKAFVKTPDPSVAAVLLFGNDALKVARAAKEISASLGGADLVKDMRLTQISAGDLRSNPALLIDAMTAASFFPGPRVVVLEGATDGLTKTIQAALEVWQEGDATLILKASTLPASSKLRKLLEPLNHSTVIGFYDDPPTKMELLEEAGQMGVRDFAQDAEAALIAVGFASEPSDYTQFLEKLAIYKMGDKAPVSVEDIDALSPVSKDTQVDDLIQAVAEGHAKTIGTHLSKYLSQGGNATALALLMTRHFKTLFQLASAGSGIEQALGKLRPPVFGPRRERLGRQARRWGVLRIETALVNLMSLELEMRSSSVAPEKAMLERVLIRLAMMVR